MRTAERNRELQIVEYQICAGEAALLHQRRVVSNPVIAGEVREGANRLLAHLERSLSVLYGYRETLAVEHAGQARRMPAKKVRRPANAAK
jgi:hypothetical protein